MDLNYRLVCKDCRTSPPQIVEDHKSGDIICAQCGLVFPMRIIDTSAETRSFAASEKNPNGSGDGGERTVGPEDSMLSGVVGLSTRIGAFDKNGSSGSGASGSGSGGLWRAQGRAVPLVKGDRDIQASFRELSVLCDSVGLPRTVCDRAKLLYKKVFDSTISGSPANPSSSDGVICRNRPNSAVVAACLFIACRQERVPRSFKEIQQLTQVHKNMLGRCVREMVSLVEERNLMGPASTEDYLSRFCSRLDLDVAQVGGCAALIVRQAVSLGLVGGRSPLSIAAASIYMTSELMALGKKMSDIVPVAGVQEVTIKSAYRDLWMRRLDVVPADREFRVPAEMLPSPF